MAGVVCPVCRTIYQPGHIFHCHGVRFCGQVSCSDTITTTAATLTDGRRWTIPRATLAASTFETRSALKRASPGLYKYLVRAGRDDLLPPDTRRRWTVESAMLVATGCRNQSDLSRQYRGAYKCLARHGVLGEILPVVAVERVRGPGGRYV